MTEYRVKPPDALEQRPDQRPEQWPLKAVALCDRLSDGVSMVYSFYDPQDEKRSLGSHMILDHIDYTRRLGLPYLYLGYWIQGSRKMSYKSRYQPQERLGPNGWVKVDPAMLEAVDHADATARTKAPRVVVRAVGR